MCTTTIRRCGGLSSNGIRKGGLWHIITLVTPTSMHASLYTSYVWTVQCDCICVSSRPLSRWRFPSSLKRIISCGLRWPESERLIDISSPHSDSLLVRSCSRGQGFQDPFVNKPAYRFLARVTHSCLRICVWNKNASKESFLYMMAVSPSAAGPEWKAALRPSDIDMRVIYDESTSECVLLWAVHFLIFHIAIPHRRCVYFPYS
jgi:hypothetical protein